MPAIISYHTKDNDIGRTVGQILRNHFGMSAGVLKDLKQRNKIFLNQEPCRSIDVVKENEIICADVSEDLMEPGNIAPFKGKLDILYEDEFILAVNKPGGIESHPCASNRNSTLANIIMYHWAQKGEKHNYHIVNRLDKGTSGICIIAKNPFTHGCLSRQTKDGILKKYYSALVHGNVENKNGEINLPIGRCDGSIIKREVRPDGKSADTVYEVISSDSDCSLLKIFLRTGRTHQIRVHFSTVGHPLFGDWLYGNGDNERELIERHALHAKTIELYHPATKEHMVFDTELPADMKNLLRSKHISAKILNTIK